MSKKIKLSDSIFVLVDDEDFDFLNQYKWHNNPKTGAVGKMFKSGDNRRQGRRSNKIMHRIIMNAPDGIEVDHKNRNKLDNRKDNLRLSTRSQNGMNTKPLSHNKCGVKGVFCDRGKWRVHISVKGKKRHYSSYDSFEEAVMARKKLAKEYHGQFAFEK